MPEFHELSREEIYELVWSEAMATLAPKFGISDVALKKRCKNLGIPTPGRGYWAKLEAGKSAKRDPLPKNFKREWSKRKVPQRAEDVPRLEPPEREYTIESPLPPVAAATRALKKIKPEENGLIQLLDASHLRFRVAPENIDRALWLWQELLVRLPGENLKLLRGTSNVTNGAESIGLEIKEMLGKYERKYDPTKDRWPSLYLDRDRMETCWAPTGVLVFRTGDIQDAGTHQWKETSLRRLEDRLDDIVTGLAKLLVRKAELEIERAERQRQWAEERGLQEQRAEERKKEEARRRRLLRLASSSDKSRMIRELCERLEHEAGEADGEKLASFLSWARSCAEDMDPIYEILGAIDEGEDPAEPDHQDLYPR